MLSDRFDDYINAHPKRCLYMLTIGISLFIHIPATLLGLFIYYLAIKRYKVSVWVLAAFSLIAFGELTYYIFKQFDHISYLLLIKETFKCNWLLVSYLFKGYYSLALQLLMRKLLTTTFYVPFLIATILGLIGLIPNKAHEETLKKLQEGMIEPEIKELSKKEIQKALTKLPVEMANQTILGVSMYTGFPVTVPDQYINQVALVLGTTGSGKTVTLYRFYEHAIQQGLPLIFIDGKPNQKDIEALKKLAEKYKRKFYGFNCVNFCHYDALASGGHTELKDKIISLKDEWSSDHYRSIAEDYLQTVFEVLLKNSDPLTLKKVVECLNYEDLKILVRATKDPTLQKKVDDLDNYNHEDITGLRAHLNILINSELGKYFEIDSNRFSLSQVIDEGAVVYFALPALRFPSFSKVLGKLVINDIKAVIDRLDNKEKKIFTIFDEFSVFAGEQVLNLVNMGRDKGVHAIFGTQGLADLQKVDITFERQLLNCTNTIICHRLNDKESAESIAEWIGTKNTFNVTGQINLKETEAALGSVRINKAFVVHPDAIKQELQIGEAFYVTKVGGFRMNKVKVKYNL